MQNIFQSLSLSTSTFLVALLVSTTTFSWSTTLWATGTEHCQPSKWGADDEIGAANYVSTERTLATIKLGSVENSFLTEIMTKICSDQMPSGYEAEIMMLSHSKHIISNKV